MTHTVAPPPLPPRLSLRYDEHREHVRVRLWQIWLTLMTTLITTWLCTLGPIPAVLGLVTAKHVLVAILAMGLNVDAPREDVWPRRN